MDGEIDALWIGKASSCVTDFGSSPRVAGQSPCGKGEGGGEGEAAYPRAMDIRVHAYCTHTQLWYT